MRVDAVLSTEEMLAPVEPASKAPIETLCMACEDADCNFRPMNLLRRPLGDNDVLIEMKYCGVCHTDLHFAANHMKGVLKTTYPCVPGHELAGICTAVGKSVTRVSVGDHVGVGCMVDSCLECKACKRGEEQMCVKQVATYQGKDFSGRAATYPAGGKTLGGYTTRHVVDERFAIIIPKSFPLEAAGPVMCAGVTMFDPLMRQGAKAGTRVGIVGLGGLGMLGIKLAKALGCVVTAISRTEGKLDIARKAGATEFVVSTDARQMAGARRSLDLILNTIPTQHDYEPYSRLLASGGKQVLLGISPAFAAALVVGLATGGRSKVIASGIGMLGAHARRGSKRGPLPISASSLPSTLPLQLQQLLDPTTPSLSLLPPPTHRLRRTHPGGHRLLRQARDPAHDPGLPRRGAQLGVREARPV